MKRKTVIESLDYEIFKGRDFNQWEVWTPDGAGACIGIGKTKRDAILNAIKLQLGLVMLLEKKLHE